MSLRAQSQSNFISAGRKRSRLIEGRIKQLFAGNGDIVFLFPVSLDPANLRRCELRGEERRGKAIWCPRLRWDSVRPRNSVEGIPIAALVISLRGAKARSGTRRAEWENSSELRGECGTRVLSFVAKVTSDTDLERKLEDVILRRGYADATQTKHISRRAGNMESSQSKFVWTRRRRGQFDSEF